MKGCTTLHYSGKWSSIQSTVHTFHIAELQLAVLNACLKFSCLTKREIIKDNLVLFGP